METLPTPTMAPLTSVFNGVYAAVANTTGSTVLATIVTVIVAVAVVYMLWQVGKWIYHLFTDEPEPRVVQYYDKLGNPVAVVT